MSQPKLSQKDLKGPPAGWFPEKWANQLANPALYFAHFNKKTNVRSLQELSTITSLLGLTCMTIHIIYSSSTKICAVQYNTKFILNCTQQIFLENSYDEFKCRMLGLTEVGRLKESRRVYFSRNLVMENERVGKIDLSHLSLVPDYPAPLQKFTLARVS